MIDNAKDILAAAPIVEVIRQYAPNLELKKAGTNFTACCPFHSEKSPSFSLSPSKNIFKCFGCGKGGDAADFLMEYAKITFGEALEKLAEVAKIKPRYAEGVDRAAYLKQQNEAKERRASLLAIFQAVVDKYAANPTKLADVGGNGLCVDVAGRTYLKTTVEKFGIYAPTDSKFISTAKDFKNYLDKLKEIGVINQSEGGNPYDIFRGRFLFLIRNDRGEPVALAGRLPQGDNSEAPKYINAKESELFTKGAILYGFDVGRKLIGSTETVYLTEGYTDVLTCHENGLENVAATCGTALTDDHCRLLKRYGVRNVVLFRDGDKAGKNATLKDVFTLVKNGLSPKVLLCDPEHDPDSQMRAMDAETRTEFVKNFKDGIIWRVMLEWDKKDPAKQTAALEVAAELLSHIENVGECDIYKKALTQGDTMGNVSKALDKEVQRFRALRAPKSKKRRGDMDEEQNAQAISYGIFKKEDRYYRYDWSDHANHTPISNFTINPQYLIKDKEAPRRIVEIRNVYGHSVVLNASTDIFASYADFKKRIAAEGNFIFEPGMKGIDFDRIVKMTYDEMNDAQGYQLIAMGWHQRGFTVWNNGITDVAGNFYEPDEYGLVNFEGTKFLLPGRAFADNDENYDKSEDDNAHIKAFRYWPGECIPFGEWQKMFMKVYGDNGMMGTAYWMASLFRDIIFPKNKCFPLLNGFGKKGKGKSTMMWSLGYLFGDARLSGVLGVSTYTAFYRSFMQVSNAIVWWDEFHNKLDLKTWVKPMMGIWDGNGRSLGNITSGHSTSTTPVRASFAYTGQDMPVNNDGALLSRSIVLTYDYERTPQAEARLSALRKVEQTGQLSKLTVQVISYREKVERLFDITFSEVKNDVTDYMAACMMDVDKMESRTLINHCIPLTVFKILMDDFDFGFTYLDLVTFAAKLIEQQANVISSSDDTGTFWKVLQFLVSDRRLVHYRDVLVEESDKVSIEKGRKETDTITFADKDGNPAPRRLIYLRLTEAHMLYSQQMRAINRDALELSTVEHYLRTSAAFIGVCKSKRFAPGRPPQRCWVFDTEKLDGVEFLLSVEMKSIPDNPSEPEPEAEKITEDLPF